MKQHGPREEHRGTCFAIGNSYAQVLHAHLLYPVSADMTRRFAQVGQNSIFGDCRTGRTGPRAERLRLEDGGANTVLMDSPKARDTAASDAPKLQTFQVYAHTLVYHLKY